MKKGKVTINRRRKQKSRKSKFRNGGVARDKGQY
jgi:hypothetical protein